MENTWKYKLSKETQDRLKEMRQIMGFPNYDKFFQWILDDLEHSRLPKLQRNAMECEKGFRATCWHCGKEFVKIEQCSTCHLYYCPHCQKCGCNLSEDARHAVYLTIKTLLGVDLESLSKSS